ncbi:MAG: tRNA (N(6)-L-threonylcarbamoyladenosine(37)-C(2))-methylthiotransferase MtaB [Ktedonobacterales bacterium]|nr:tRNA (N(6)-L-threonylcarbamoyladenosine(37)-C(2))-methylthiotransferase MtaB [Ktedonobacterales bacterium]
MTTEIPTARPAPPTFRVQTLGCKVNAADSEAIAAELVARGLTPAQGDAPADVSVVNTCTVTHLGDRSSRQMLAQARRAAPSGLVVATGCYAQVAPAAVAALPGVDLVIPNTHKDELVNAIFAHAPTLLPMFPAAENPDDHFLAQVLGKTRAQVKVQDGCDNRCTYCIVPTARGASRSRTIREIVALAQRKAAAGIGEIVLTGVHLGDFHPTPGEDLGTLLAALLAETTIPRIRVSSLEPEDFRTEWLALWANPRLCRHLHLPLQSGSDAVLRRMARRYTMQRYREIAAAAHAAIPELALTTDIIVGFPGETADDAAQTLSNAASIGFAKLHVFRYSPRTGTAAARMRPQVPDAAKRARSEALLALNDDLMHQFRARHLGRAVEVLWEAPRPWGWEGLTDNYLRVELRGDDIPPERDLRHTRTWTRVTAIGDDAVLGTLVSKETNVPLEVRQ